MKKLLFILFFMMFLPVSAIEWLDTASQKGAVVSIDKDSIKAHKNYYFYNIKTTKNNGEEVVVTIQAQKNHPFCARLKHYTLQDYVSLNGDYENITLNQTVKLEPMVFESRAYAAYKKVIDIMGDNNKVQITF